MNLYYFGGTFDPPHLGHKRIVNYFYKRADQMLLVPTYHSPLKNHFPICSYSHRVKMIKLMFSELKNVKILNKENSSKLIYTCNTLAFLKDKYPDSHIHLVIGSDQLTDFSNWKNESYIINNCNLIVVSRSGFEISDSKYKFEICDDIKVDVSSSEIRKNITDLSFIRSKLDENVYDYIMRNKLYI